MAAAERARVSVYCARAWLVEAAVVALAAEAFVVRGGQLGRAVDDRQRLEDAQA
ncbi:MAG: hypothetical protein ACRDG7_13325 [Candidatus Limnocylindria bacterium]